MSTAALRLTRRQALGLAAGGAAGAAGLRLATLHLGGGSPSAQAVAAASGLSSDWASPLGSSRGLAAHLLRRAGFAFSAAELDAAASMRYADLVDGVVTQAPDPLPMPPNPTDYRSVVQTWYQHMATTRAQFPERMTLFWHGHLTSDYRKAARRPYVHVQNATWREKGVTDLRSMLLAATYDPLMMEYLDLSRSSGAAPNENYSREVMELYALGPGNYTEADVRAGARAFSGIRVAAYNPDGSPAKLPVPGKGPEAQQQYYQELQQLVQSGVTLRGALAPRLHDQGVKTFLGRTGNLGPEEAVDAILAKDAAASFIARAAIVHFAVPQPDDAYVARVADAFRRARYDIRTLMRTIFTSEEFTGAGAYRALVRSPADYMVATMRVLGQPELSQTAVNAGQMMDQILYDPPTVGGWPSNGGWVSSNAWLGRLNFAHTVVNRGGTFPDPVAAVQTHLDGVVGTAAARVVNASQSASDRWYALLASPEFQLK